MTDRISVIGHHSLRPVGATASVSLLAEGAVTVGAGLLELLVGLRRLGPGGPRVADDPGQVLRRPEEVVHGPGPVLLRLLPLPGGFRERAGLLAQPDQRRDVRGQRLAAGRFERGGGPEPLADGPVPSV